VASFAAAGFGAVFLPAGAGVVVVGAAVAARRHADVGATAATAANESGEDVVGGVAAAAGDIVAALAQDRLCAGEGELVNERLVLAVEQLVAPADPAGVGGVGEDEVHGRVTPARRRRWRLLGAQSFGDGNGP
jgi:hypothetical protein